MSCLEGEKAEPSGEGVVNLSPHTEAGSACIIDPPPSAPPCVPPSVCGPRQVPSRMSLVARGYLTLVATFPSGQLTPPASGAVASVTSVVHRGAHTGRCQRHGAGCVMKVVLDIHMDLFYNLWKSWCGRQSPAIIR